MKTFSNKWNLKRHCNVHKNLNSHKCDICSLTFKKHGQLKKHVSIHMGLKPFACKTCNESFQEKKDLKRHEKKHKTYFCNQENCEKEFITFHALRTHKKIAHPKCKELCSAYKLKKKKK